jgi:hypothetical protein
VVDLDVAAVTDPTTRLATGWKERLRYATEGPALDGKGGFKDVRIDRLTVTELGAWRSGFPSVPPGRSRKH